MPCSPLFYILFFFVPSLSYFASLCPFILVVNLSPYHFFTSLVKD